jgi:glycosyltransferase involved in cell wall biosynthesis
MTEPRQPGRVLIISHDLVGHNMAGPGIRYYHLARVLAQHLPTTLAVPAPIHELQDEDMHVVEYRRRAFATLTDHVAAADVCVFASDVADELPELATSGKHLVVDGYDPLLAEWLALSDRLAPFVRTEQWRRRMVELGRQYLIGDFYICASERQRDWWLGLLEASGRLNPATFGADPSLRTLVDVVPYGLPAAPLPAPRRVIRGAWPGIGADDLVLLWGGGLWPWLDPVTAIRAVDMLRARLPHLRLIFPGTRHPNPAMSGMPTQTEHARAVASELNLLDHMVFFGDWVPYSDWSHVLQEANVALTLHFDTLETRLAFRSRVLEYIWAGLPTVATGGDATSDLVRDYDLGIVVEPENVAGVAAAIERLVSEPRGARTAQFGRARRELTWERAAVPLVRYCLAPQAAADKRAGEEPAAYDPVASLRAERDHWRALAQAYADGRMMRLLAWVDRQRRSLRSGRSPAG